MMISKKKQPVVGCFLNLESTQVEALLPYPSAAIIVSLDRGASHKPVRIYPDLSWSILCIPVLPAWRRSKRFISEINGKPVDNSNKLK